MGKRPAQLPASQVVSLCRKAAMEKGGVALTPTRHLARDHPERGLSMPHVAEALLDPAARVEPAHSRYSEAQGVWSYRLETRIKGHRMRIVVVFDPPIPNLDGPYSVRVVTAFFPDEPGGVIPEDLKPTRRNRT